ncbi:MAG: hypothetical protein MZV70_32945 [Desulfobacterales bacterium]|nr:hypothetical protein [Desulfobacterales bacterium]
MVDAIRTILLIQVDNSLAIAAGIEVMPLECKATAKFLIIVYFTIGHQTYVPVLVEKGLSARLDADNGQPGVGHGNVVRNAVIFVIRPAMSQGLLHESQLPHEPFCASPEVKDAGYATHANFQGLVYSAQRSSLGADGCFSGRTPLVVQSSQHADATSRLWKLRGQIS